MNDSRGRKVQKIDTPVPGCLGRMVNLFDLGTPVNANKLLTDKPHLDGSSLSRTRSDATQMPSPSYKGHSQPELIMSDLRTSASTKVDGTPMKKLIAREMSKEVQHKQSSTNVVAKLMGLETLPQMDLETAARRTKSRSNSHSSLIHSVSLVDHEVQKYQELSREFKDVYETWQSPQKASRSWECSPRKGRYDESIAETQMALVRQKFAEAKRLVTDENLRQSKEFQEALEFLSSNKDLFVKFVQDSSSFSQSQHISGFQPVPPHPEAKRITVLRPSKAVETEKCVFQGRKNKQAKKFVSSSHESGWGNCDLGYSSSYVNRGTEEHPAQPTRIVVLKPSLGKSLNIKAVSSSTSSPRGLHNGSYFDKPGDVEIKEVAKEITRQVRENLMGHRWNETQSSSVLSNVNGDDSSFNKSDNKDPVENFSDSEIMSPTSRHSWDCPHRFESHLSPSFSRVSFSPESSVCREAKKRLSERWTLMSVNRGCQPYKHVPRTSSTLGDMLALSETKVKTGSYEESNEEAPETRVSTSCITSDMNKVEMASDSLNILARSKSVPEVRLNGEASVLGSRAQAPRELAETASLKLSWKVSNLFFFKNKKSSKEKRDASENSSISQLPIPGKIKEDCLFHGDCIPPGESLQQSITPGEEELTTPRPLAAGNTSENQEQPSPISVLFPPFEEECVGIPECSGSTKLWTTQGEDLKSNLIDKSPSIGSIARILLWDEHSCTDISNPATEVHEDEDWFLFIETLLTAAGFSKGSTISHEQLMYRWLLPNSPLDPSLRDKYTNQDNNIKEFSNQGRQQRRSTCKLIFDRVNDIISETMITHTGNGSLRFDLVEHVWAQIKDWLSEEPSKRDTGEYMDANSLAAQSLVNYEILGRKWTHGLQIEIDDFGIEIESRLLQELMEEAVVDFTR